MVGGTSGEAGNDVVRDDAVPAGEPLQLARSERLPDVEEPKEEEGDHERSDAARYPEQRETLTDHLVHYDRVGVMAEASLAHTADPYCDRRAGGQQEDGGGRRR